MTAPAEEAVEQKSDLEPLIHYLCPNCLPPVGTPVVALCGTPRPSPSGEWGFQSGDCHVCRSLWISGFTCRHCGYTKLPKGVS